MTTHELARALLEMPNQPVVFPPNTDSERPDMYFPVGDCREVQLVPVSDGYRDNLPFGRQLPEVSVTVLE